MMKILVFGTGIYYNKYKAYFPLGSIIALLDNDSKKQGTLIDGLPVLSAEIGIKLSYDFIYILTKYESEIRNQLMKLGVRKDTICNRHDISRVYACKKHTLYKNNFVNLPDYNDKKILLITHGMDFSGAPMALFSMGCVLLSAGYSVAVAAGYDNEKVRTWLISLGMDVIVSPDIEIGSLNDLSWTQDFNLVIVNTICLYYLLRRRSSSFPVLWWLHDAEEYYAGISSRELQHIVSHDDNLKIVAVSQIAKRYFCNRVSSAKVELLPYGLDDFFVPLSDSQEDKCIFAIIGDVIRRKGTDVFLDAAEIIGEKNYKGIEFWIIGNDSTEFGQCIKKRAETMNDVRVFGKVPHDELERIYSKITALVIPSRDDILPIVAVEAMMNRKGCIISRNNDIAKYIEDCNAGVVCPSDNSKDWAEVMEWVIGHRNEWKIMGERGRMIYENIFSMESFKNKCLGIIKQMIV